MGQTRYKRFVRSGPPPPRPFPQFVVLDRRMVLDKCMGWAGRAGGQRESPSRCFVRGLFRPFGRAQGAMPVGLATWL